MHEEPTLRDDASPEPTTTAADRLALSRDDLRWRCDAGALPFRTTAEVETAPGIVGQDAAVEALQFGLQSRAAGQNVFVRGLTGTGRMTLVRQMLEGIAVECPPAPDRCFVHNFEQRDRPKLLTLRRGTARTFARMVDELIAFIRDDLSRALGGAAIRNRQSAMERAAHERLRAVVDPFERELKEAGLAFVSVESGPVSHGALFPLVDGKPVPPEEFEERHARGEVSDEARTAFDENVERFRERFQDVTRQVVELRTTDTESMRSYFEGEARSVLTNFTDRIATRFKEDGIRTFLQEIVEDVVENHLGAASDEDFTRRYRVNIVVEHPLENGCPIVVENSPTLVNLLGSIDREIGPGGTVQSDHLMIHAGSLLRADGGFLILDARDVLSEPGAWKVLVRTLRTGRLEIIPAELLFPWGGHGIKPEPIDLELKVVLMGDSELYYMLDQLDPDFPQLFKVLADFDSLMPRDERGIAHYTAVIARVTETEKLPPFDRDGVAALVEHGARIAARRGKLTARFSRLADIMREAAFLARRDGRDAVGGDDVRQTIARTKRRADLPSRRFRELLADGTIKVQTSGATVGQINGLAVLQAGQVGYGFPARITATIGAGSAGVLNIEREANLSGAIHTKGFYILGGLLRYLLRTEHPLAFDASIAFEQSYGGIDGDSASGAEICCLLSALTDVPIRQDLAMTGAIDQLGHILAVGAVNEKIEGFFDTCRDIGLTGNQGVIIPAANAGDLMLRHDIVEAREQERFHVYAVETVHDALAILTDRPAGRRGDDGRYPADSVLGVAVERARVFWRKASARPRRALPPTDDDAPDGRRDDDWRREPLGETPPPPERNPLERDPP